MSESVDVPVRTLIAPLRYVQGRGALARLGEFVRHVGERPLVVDDHGTQGGRRAHAGHCVAGTGRGRRAGR